MNIFLLEILNVCMFLYADLHDFWSPSETDRLDWLGSVGFIGLCIFSFAHFRICDKSARHGKGEIEKKKREKERET